MRQDKILVAGLFIVFLLFGCAALGVLTYVSDHELATAFRQIFAIFSASAQAVTVALALVIVAGAVGALAFYGRQAWLRDRAARAEVARLEREADQVFTVAKPGDQVFVSEGGYHKPLHLQAGPINARASHFTDAEWRRWAFHNQAHATTKKPRIIEGDNLPMLGPGAPVELPEVVNYFDLLPTGRGDLNNLLLGVSAGEGRLEPVTISLYDLFHTVIAASSGWGKSAFANNILAQLATCDQPVELVLIDQQAHGLTSFRNCDRLRYPLLRDPGEILGALREIHSEATEQRSALFERLDADDLRHYNSLADEPLPPVVVAVDEASALLGNKDIATELKRQAWELRKFGVYQILMLTSAKGSTIDTDHRQQFSSKVQMHANDRWQARMLLNAPQALEFPPGRAIVDLPGRSLTEVQTPFIKRDEVKTLLGPAAGAAPDLPKVAVSDRTQNGWDVDLVLEMHANDASLAEIARANGKTPGGKQNDQIRAILAEKG